MNILFKHINLVAELRYRIGGLRDFEIQTEALPEFSPLPLPHQTLNLGATTGDPSFSLLQGLIPHSSHATISQNRFLLLHFRRYFNSTASKTNIYLVSTNTKNPFYLIVSYNSTLHLLHPSPFWSRERCNLRWSCPVSIVCRQISSRNYDCAA